MAKHEEGHHSSTLWTSYSILGKYINIQFNFDVDSNEKFTSELTQQWSKSEEIKKKQGTI